MANERSSGDYVTRSAWVRDTGRVDAIDEIADQFERPVAPGAEAFWTPATGIRRSRAPLARFTRRGADTGQRLAS